MTRACLTRYLMPLAVALPLAGFHQAAGAQSLSKPGRQPGELERIQLHRNSLRGVHYLSTWQAGGTLQPEQFTLRVTRNIGLDGDPELNVRGNVYPIDVDGNGAFGLLHFNGYRVMRVYSRDGNKLWQVKSPPARSTAAPRTASRWRSSTPTATPGRRSSTAGLRRASRAGC
jgi:hypothetical protein